MALDNKAACYGSSLYETIRRIFAARPPLTHVYLLQGECGGPIKIGQSKFPEIRAMKLQCGNPEELYLLDYFPNVPPSFETKLQNALDEYRIRGEWFSPDVLLVIEDVASALSGGKATLASAQKYLLCIRTLDDIMEIAGNPRTAVKDVQHQISEIGSICKHVLQTLSEYCSYLEDDEV